MENWATAGVFLAKLLANISDNNSQTSERDIRNIVQEEMRNSQNNKEQDEFLRDVMRLLEEKRKEEKQDESEKNIRAQLEELSRKLDRMDRNKKIQDNREWVQELFERISVANAGGGYRPRQYSRGFKSNRQNTGTPNSNDHLPWMDGPKRQNTGTPNSNDHLPWMDGPKSQPNSFQKGQAVDKDESFVMVNAKSCSFNSRGRGNYRGGHGLHPRPASQGKQNNHQSTQHGNIPQGHKNYQQQGNYRGRGRGAVPKNSTGGRAPNQGEIKHLSAKLESLSTTDVKVSLSPQEIVTLKNALQSSSNSGKQSGAKANQGNNQSSGSRSQQPRTHQHQQSDNKSRQQSAGRAQSHTNQNQRGMKQQTGQRKKYDGTPRRPQDQEEEGCSLM